MLFICMIFFGVAGAQGSVDYEDQGFPEVGEIPFSCVWTARGKLLAGDDPSTDVAETIHVMWTKPERLTSGTRDANLPAVDCAAGCWLYPDLAGRSRRVTPRTGSWTW